MMNKYLELPSILISVLSILVGFILGAFLSTLTGAVIAALAGLIASIIVIRTCTLTTIRNINWILITMLVIFVAIMVIMIGPHVIMG